MRSLAQWISVSAVRGCGALRGQPSGSQVVPVHGLPASNFAHRRQLDGAHQVAVDDLVSGDLPHQPSQDRPVGAGTQASARGELPHRAWLLHQKINRAMARQEATHRLDGAVQIDDAYLGGERAGGTPGRGSENKVPFVAAVALDAQGSPKYIKLNLVSGFTSAAIGKWASANLMPGSVVTSDGLGCFAAVTDAGCVHTPVVVGQLKPRDLPQFKWVNTVLGNLKTTLAGAFHSLNYSKYAENYLAAFAYRFNRRFDLRSLVMRLIVDVARTEPAKKDIITVHAEARF